MMRPLDYSVPMHELGISPRPSVEGSNDIDGVGPGKVADAKTEWPMKYKSQRQTVRDLIGKPVPRPKTLDLRLAVTASDLGAEIMRAFNLAKSAGKELNATFTPGAS